MYCSASNPWAFSVFYCFSLPPHVQYLCKHQHTVKRTLLVKRTNQTHPCELCFTNNSEIPFPPSGAALQVSWLLAEEKAIYSVASSSMYACLCCYKWNGLHPRLHGLVYPLHCFILFIISFYIHTRPRWPLFPVLC